MPNYFVPYGKQDIQKKDIDYVVNVLKSDFLTQGPCVPQFENSVKNYCGANYAAAVNSATSALHISLLALDVGPGDYVWTSPVSFVASANAALYCGAKIDFVDIDPFTYNMCSNSLEKKLKAAKLNNLLPKVVIPVHLSGLPCDMKAIHRLSKKYGFNIVEDASHAIGASYQKNKIGSCNFSDITVFSFHPVKIITTGEGGIALTNNKKLYQKFELFRSHGITRDPNFMTQPPDGLWYYQQLELGYNYRMSDIQAGLGISQMSRIDEYIRKRHNIAEFYDSELKNCSLVLPYHPQDAYSSYHLYIIRLLENNQTKHQELFAKLRQLGIGVNLH